MAEALGCTPLVRHGEVAPRHGEGTITGKNNRNRNKLPIPNRKKRHRKCPLPWSAPDMKC